MVGGGGSEDADWKGDVEDARLVWRGTFMKGFEGMKEQLKLDMEFGCEPVKLLENKG